MQYVRRLFEGICEAFSIKLLDQQAVDFCTETVVSTIQFGIEQPRALRRNAIRRSRGRMVEYEVDEELIANTHTKLYKDFYNKAITNLIERYPCDELEELEKLENFLCKPCSEDVAHIFEKYNNVLHRSTRSRPLHTRYSRSTSLPNQTLVCGETVHHDCCQLSGVYLPWCPHPADSLFTYACHHLFCREIFHSAAPH